MNFGHDGKGHLLWRSRGEEDIRVVRGRGTWCLWDMRRADDYG
jgi:hypothetical protein